MKTNRTMLRRLAIIVGTLWMAAQGAAQAETAPVAAPQYAAPVKSVAVDQSRILLASASCTRVGNRMVC